MANDELTLVWQQLDMLHEALAELIELQRAALEAPRPPAHGEAAAPGQPSPALALVSERLAALRHRLQPTRAEAARYAAAEEPRRLAEIAVERLNVVEPEGTLRLALSGAARAPDPVVDGQTLIGARKGGNCAGLLFYNEEGDECDGLVYSGYRQGQGYAAEAGLLFDQFRQDQVLGLMHGDENGQRWAGLWVWDRPDMPMIERRAQWEAIGRMPKGPEQRAAARAMGFDEVQRVFVGKTEDRTAIIRLCDTQRRVRLRLAVDAAGAASIEFLDEAGTVTHRLPDPAPDAERDDERRGGG